MVEGAPEGQQQPKGPQTKSEAHSPHLTGDVKADGKTVEDVFKTSGVQAAEALVHDAFSQNNTRDYHNDLFHVVKGDTAADPSVRGLVPLIDIADTATDPSGAQRDVFAGDYADFGAKVQRDDSGVVTAVQLDNGQAMHVAQGGDNDDIALIATDAHGRTSVLAGEPGQEAFQPVPGQAGQQQGDMPAGAPQGDMPPGQSPMGARQDMTPGGWHLPPGVQPLSENGREGSIDPRTGLPTTSDDPTLGELGAIDPRTGQPLDTQMLDPRTGQPMMENPAGASPSSEAYKGFASPDGKSVYYQFSGEPRPSKLGAEWSVDQTGQKLTWHGQEFPPDATPVPDKSDPNHLQFKQGDATTDFYHFGSSDNGDAGQDPKKVLQVTTRDKGNVINYDFTDSDGNDRHYIFHQEDGKKDGRGGTKYWGYVVETNGSGDESGHDRVQIRNAPTFNPDGSVHFAEVSWLMDNSKRINPAGGEAGLSND